MSDYTRIKVKPFYIDLELATEIGLKTSVVLGTLRELLEMDLSPYGLEHTQYTYQDKKWLRIRAKDLCEVCPYIGSRTIIRALHRLQRYGLIISGSHGATFDQGKSYTVLIEKLRAPSYSHEGNCVDTIVTETNNKEGA